MKPKSSRAASALTLLFAGTALAGTASAAVLIDATLNNGGFNTVSVKTNFTTPVSSTTSIPFWGATLVNPAGAAVATPPDSGVQAGGNVVQEGTSGAFFQGGGRSTAFNLVTSYTIQAGDIFTLTWYAYKTGNNGQQAVTLFSQAAASVGTTWS